MEDDEEEEPEEIDEDDVIGMKIKKNGDMILRVNLDSVMNLITGDDILQMPRVFRGIISIKFKAITDNEKKSMDIVLKNFQFASL